MHLLNKYETPIISIGIPVYNGSPFIRLAILSALAQTFTNFEIILSNNASTDDTYNIVVECVKNDPRVKIFQQTENIGMIENFLFVLNHAQGRYFTWLAADDIWSPNYLEELLATYCSKKNVVLAFPEVVVIDESNRVTRNHPKIFELSDKENLLDRMHSFLWSEESEGKANLACGLFERRTLINYFEKDYCGLSYGFGNWGTDYLFMFDIGKFGQYVGTHRATLFKRALSTKRYDLEDFREHFREMHGYFQGYRALIQKSTLNDADKDFLLASLSARECVWYARLLRVDTEWSQTLKARLEAMLDLQAPRRRQKPSVGPVVTSSAPAMPPCSTAIPERITTEPTQLAGIVFSKDRPLQLDGTLRSFFLHCQDPDDIVLKVLYTTSDAEQEAAYRQLAQNHPGVVFVREKSFKQDLLFQLQDFEYALFAVDDTIFVRDFHLGDCVRCLDDFPDAIGFSLRLGENTTYCYTLDRPQRLPVFEPVNANTILFEWTTADCDFNYPIEVSSSVYRLRNLQSFLERLDYKNPNTLESKLGQSAPLIAVSLPRLLSARHSIAFSVPINKVQDVNNNRAGVHRKYSVPALNALFHDGYRLDVVKYSHFTPNACHQEVELELVRKPAAPLVSVIVPCYNQANFLAESVGSILAQSFMNWECIVINDGSPDNTSEVAKQMMAMDPHGRIRLIEKPNGGLASARNAGVRIARGSLILPLDADDMLHPSYLSEAVIALETHPDCAIVYVDEQNFGNSNHVHRKGNASLNMLMCANAFDYCSLYRKEVWASVGGYSPAMYLGGEDWNFWLAAVKHGFKSLHLPKPLFLYRNRENTMVADTLANLKEVWAHIVFHHPNLYGEQQRQEARNILSMSPVKNLTKLESVRNKHPLNSRLQFFAKMASTKNVSATGKILRQPARGNSPLVSVIIPTFNRPDQLVNAVQSVLGQTYTVVEALVINDFGIDVSKILKAFNDERIVHIRHQKNKGLAAARNTGIQVAKGKYIAYLDDDDEFYPDHIQTLVDALENSNFKAAYTDGEKCLYEERNGELFLSSKFVEHSSEFDPFRLLAQNYIPVLCMMHEKACLDHIGLFDETMSVHEDWDLWARMSRHFPFVHIKKTTCSYRIILNANKNMTTSKQLDFVRTMQQIYRKHRNITEKIPQFVEFQNKCLINLSRSLYPQSQLIDVSVGDNFDIYINGTLLT